LWRRPIHRIQPSPFRDRIDSRDALEKIARTSFRKRRLTLRIRWVCFHALLFLALAAHHSLAQNAPADSRSAPSLSPTDSKEAPTKAAEPQPLPNPSISGQLETAVPHEAEGGKLAVKSAGQKESISLAIPQPIGTLAMLSYSCRRLPVGGSSTCRVAPITWRPRSRKHRDYGHELHFSRMPQQS
jgi:hypothetical protein